MTQEIIKWLASGETGASSKTMAFTALGQKYTSQSAPSDPADLNRCIKLLDAAPEVLAAFPEIAKLSKRWAAVVENWDALRESFIAEVGYDWCKAQAAPVTYKKMKDLGL